jgi:uncharacterized tellurite resistance protein B-like protein
MTDKLSGFFSQNILASGKDDITVQYLAAAGLLVEVMVIDGNLDDQEVASIAQTICQVLGLPRNQVDTLIELAQAEIELAQAEVSQADSLSRFTREINTHFSRAEKKKLLTAMWRVAFSDGTLDRAEGDIVQRTSKLLHMRMSECDEAEMIAKNQSAYALMGD